MIRIQRRKKAKIFNAIWSQFSDNNKLTLVRDILSNVVAIFLKHLPTPHWLGYIFETSADTTLVGVYLIMLFFCISFVNKTSLCLPYFRSINKFQFQFLFLNTKYLRIQNFIYRNGDDQNIFTDTINKLLLLTSSSPCLQLLLIPSYWRVFAVHTRTIHDMRALSCMAPLMMEPAGLPNLYFIPA